HGDRMRRGARRVAGALVLAALVSYAIPFFWQLLTSFKPEAELLRVPPLLPSQLTLAHYRAVVEKSLMPQALANSFGIATLTTLLALAVGVARAYAGAQLSRAGTWV